MEQEMNDTTSPGREKSVVRRIVTSKLFLIVVFSHPDLHAGGLFFTTVHP